MLLIFVFFKERAQISIILVFTISVGKFKPICLTT